MRVVAPIVEGHGDELALPSLLNRIAPGLVVGRVVRVPKTKLVDPETRLANATVVHRAVLIANANIPEGATGLLLLLIDSDSDCAATLGPSLLAAMTSAGSNRACFVAVAIRGFESWIIGGVPEIDEADPERAGDPKLRIKKVNGGNYKKTADQKAFAARVEPPLLAARSPSFSRLNERISLFAHQM